MLYDKVTGLADHLRIERLRHLMRIAIELGTDALKIAAPPHLFEIKNLLANLSQDVEIFFAGGSLGDDAQLLSLVREASLHGAAGLCVGRNIFQRPDPKIILNQIRAQLLTFESETRAVIGRPTLVPKSEANRELH